MSRYIHDKVNHQLIPVSGYGSRMATSIEDKTLTIHGSYANVEGYNYGKADITDAVELIAPIETELVASRAYSVGDQFVYRGFLYKVTAAIALDAPIVIGTNCQVAPDVSEQIGDLTDIIDTLNATVTDLKTVKTISGSGSYGSLYSAYKYGNVVFLRVYNITAAQNKDLNIVVLPEGYRPKDTCMTVALNGSGSMNYNALCAAIVRTNGLVYLYTYAAFSNGYLSATYIV